jgi:hypothetical protein
MEVYNIITLSGSKLEGRRAIGKPRRRWLEVVEKDLRKMKFSKWRLKGIDREQWASIISELTENSGRPLLGY